jgi:hypothetical protein
MIPANCVVGDGSVPIAVAKSPSHELRALTVGFWTVSPARTSSGCAKNSFRYWHTTGAIRTRTEIRWQEAEVRRGDYAALGRQRLESEPRQPPAQGTSDVAANTRDVYYGQT